MTDHASPGDGSPDHGTNGQQPNSSDVDSTALHVAFVLDKSGSMAHLVDPVVAGFDEYVGELRTEPGETLLTLTMFDTVFRHVHVARRLAEVPSLADTGYEPGGMTALFDAVAHAILETDRGLTAAGRADEKVLVVVMTDGQENSSTDYDAETIAKLVAEYDARPNWTFVYLGAAHGTLEDARAAAGKIAFTRENTMRWTADRASARKSMHSLAHASLARKRAFQFKGRQFFEEAGQDEGDYLADPPGPGSSGSNPASGEQPPRNS